MPLNAVSNNKRNTANFINDIVQPNEIPEQNQKFANEMIVLFDKFGQDTLLYYYSSILNIAQQCPNSGGVGVFVMRNFVELFNDTLEYDDANTCLQQGFYKQSQTNVDSNIVSDFLIVPNPASNEIEVRLLNPHQGICEIEIRNVVGEKVVEQTIDCKKSSQSILLNYLQQGVYFVRVTNSNNIQLQHKLIIIK